MRVYTHRLINLTSSTDLFPGSVPTFSCDALLGVKLAEALLGKFSEVGAVQPGDSILFLSEWQDFPICKAARSNLEPARVAIVGPDFEATLDLYSKLTAAKKAEISRLFEVFESKTRRSDSWRSSWLDREEEKKDSIEVAEISGLSSGEFDPKDLLFFAGDLVRTEIFKAQAKGFDRGKAALFVSATFVSAGLGYLIGAMGRELPDDQSQHSLRSEVFKMVADLPKKSNGGGSCSR